MLHRPVDTGGSHSATGDSILRLYSDTGWAWMNELPRHINMLGFLSYERVADYTDTLKLVFAVCAYSCT